MLKDFISLPKGSVVLQNASNSGVGQSVIQLCKAFGYKSVNFIRDRPDFDRVREELVSMGADLVFPESMSRSSTVSDQIGQLCTVSTPQLALNGVGGKSATNLARLLG
jgi:trans-2-enoyl-CoA reductase